MDFRQALMTVQQMSRTQLREYLYADHRNLLKELDQSLSEEIFGRDTPFRFCKRYLISSTYEGILRLARAYDVYRYGMEYSSIFRERIAKLRSFNYQNLFQGSKPGKAYKDLIKGWMSDMNISFIDQLLLSFFLGIYVFITNDVKDRLMADYLEEFERNEPNMNFSFFEEDDDREAISALAKLIECTVVPENAKMYEISPPRNSFSSTGRMKKFDQKELIDYCDTHSEMNRYARQYLLSCITCIEIYYNKDLSQTRQKLESLVETDDDQGIQFLPRLTFVTQSKGKIGRPVIEGNDFGDMALEPFMNLLKTLMSKLPSNFSRSNRYSKSMYTKVNTLSKKLRKGVKIGDVVLKGSMADIDSSNATERISGRYQWHLFEMLWDSLSEDFRAKTGITDAYLGVVEKLLCETPFSYETPDGIGISFTYGTCQGIMGSWDLLNLTMCLLILLSWKDELKNVETHYQHNQAVKALYNSCHNGDDAGYLEDIDLTIKRRLQGNSLDGVISEDKSASESEVGYFAFSSAYVRTHNTPRLSNLRLVSLLVAFADPDSIHVYEEDTNMKHQLMMGKKLLDVFRTSYNILGMPMIDDNIYYQRARSYKVAADHCRFIIYRYLLPNSIVDIKPDMACAYDDCLAPSIRCRNVVIYNKHITGEQLQRLKDEVTLEECFEIRQEYKNLLLDEILDNRDQYIATGKTPYFSDDDIQNIFNTYLNLERNCNEYGYCSYYYDLSQLEDYHFCYQGYNGRDDQVVKVTIQWL